MKIKLNWKHKLKILIQNYRTNPGWSDMCLEEINKRSKLLEDSGDEWWIIFWGRKGGCSETDRQREWQGQSTGQRDEETFRKQGGMEGDLREKKEAA